MAKQLLIIAGGQSVEHEVSLSSASTVVEGLADTDVSVKTIIISKEGRWLDPASSLRALRGKPVETNGDRWHMSSFISHLNERHVIFPLVHGTSGEDGVLQGFLQMLNIPYIGCGVLTSAVCMNKPMFKDVAKAHSFPQVKYLCFQRNEFEINAQQLFDKVRKELSPPWVVKPACLGSSIGVVRVEEESRLKFAFTEAFENDRRILVEEAVSNLWELEVGVIGNETPRTSFVGRNRYETGIHDYETKYQDGGTTLIIPADVPVHIAEACQSMALKAYRVYGCSGFARVDFFYDYSRQRIMLNEINTLPGFTKTSMFLQLWETEGGSCAQIVQELMKLARELHCYS